jgi:hypothetical protein
MKTPKKNPIAATVLPLQGKQMEPNWQKQTQDFGGNFDRRDLEKLWLNPQWSSKLSADNVDNVIRNSRLSSYAPSASGV